MGAKGNPKTPGSGRKKGTPNKSRLELLDVCAHYNCDPFEGMVILAVAERDPDKKFNKLEKIASYVYAKPKAIEHSGEIVTAQPVIRVESLDDRIKKLMSK